jgi:RHS repeat-associated protein
VSILVAATVVQALDYFPFGAPRIDTRSVAEAPKQYIGQYFDQASNLNYLNARYYDSSRGQFLTQDPLFLSSSQNLQDPQSLNSYSYSDDNPITKSDPTGKQWEELVPLGIQMLRAYLVNATIGESLRVGTNIYGNVQQGVQSNDLTPSSFVPTLSGQDYLTTALEAAPSSVLGPVGGKTAELVGASRLLGNSTGVGIGAVAMGEFEAPSTGEDQTQILWNGALTGFGNYGAGWVWGGVPGRDVQSINANFFLGSHMQNEIRTGVTSQAFASGASTAGAGSNGMSSLVSLCTA